MLLCNFKAPSGKPSNLYNDLKSRFGDESATRIWNYIRSQEFANKFLDGELYDSIVTNHKDEEGNLVSGPELQFHFDIVYKIPVDENGEPTIAWVLENIDVPKTSVATPATITPSFTFEMDKSTGYKARTLKNASADATIAFAWDFKSAGEKLTKKSVTDQGKKYHAVNIPTRPATGLANAQYNGIANSIIQALNEVSATSINIAGNGIYTMKDAGWSQEELDEMTYQILKLVVESPNLNTKITQIRTGGQTGFDEAGAKAGLKLGIPTLILAPKGWKFRDITGKDISSEVQFKARFQVGDVKPAVPSTKEEAKPARKVFTVADLGVGKKDNKIAYTEALIRVNEFYNQALENPTEEYNASSFKAEDLKRPTSSGFTPVEIANMFAGFPIPPNVKFDPLFGRLIINTATFQTNNWEMREVPFLKYNEAQLKNVLDEYFIPIRDANRTKTGKTFTSEQQVAGVDSIVTLVWSSYSKDPTVAPGILLARGGTVFNTLTAYRKRYILGEGLPEWMTPSMTKSWADNIELVLNSWEDFVGRAVYRLADYGLTIRNLPETYNMQSLVGDDLDDKVDAIQGETGQNIRDWSESSFEQDPKSTAHTRMKLFLASMREVTKGTEREPQKIKLPFNDKTLRDRILGKNPILGTKTETIRTAAQIKDLGVRQGKQYITTVNDDEQKLKFRVYAEKTLTADDLQDEDIQAIAQEENIDPQVGDMILRLEPWVPNENALIHRENFVGLASLVDFEELFQGLLEVLNDTPNTIEAVIAKLEEEAENFRPIYQEVANQLKAQRDDLQREFVKVMSKQYQEFSIVLFSKRRGGMLDTTEINANRGSAINTIVESWKENQKNAEIVQRTPDGNLIINDDLAQDLMDELLDYQEVYNQGEFPPMDSLKKFAKKILDVNGIILPDAAFERLFAQTSKVTDKTAVAGGIQDQFKINADGTPRGIFSALVMKLAGVTKEDAKGDGDGDATYLLNNNPLYTENTSIGVLAKLTYQFSAKTASGSHRNSEGKNIYAFGQNSFLSSSMKKIHNDPAFLARLGSTRLGNRSWLLQRLITDSEARDKFDMRYVDGLKQAYRKNARGVKRDDMSSREQLLFALAQFQHQKSVYGNFLSPTMSDKVTTPLFTGIAKFDPDSAEAKDAIYHTFLGEYERVKDWYINTRQNGQPSANDSYNKGGGFYYFIPELNYDFLAKEVKNGSIPQESMDLIWTSKGVPNTRTPVASTKDFVLRVFDKYFLKPEQNKLVQDLKNEGFVTQKLIDFAYMRKNIRKVGLKLENPKAQLRIYLNMDETEAFTEDVAVDAFLPWMAKDYIINSFLVNTALSSMFYGDPALAYKGKSTIDYIQVAETMTEYSKRLAKDIAPGQDPTWDSPDETYQTITLQDDERLHSYLQGLSKYANKKINGTDAQEFTTVREHLYVLKSLGGAIPGTQTILNPKVYDEMIQIIDEGLETKDKYYEFVKPEHVAIIMQIMKPVSVSYDFDEVPGTAVIHYVKSSAMPLYPPMTQYYEIDELRQALEGTKEGGHIPRANFISSKKMGAPAGKGVQIFDADGKINVDTKSPTWTNSIQTLDREGLRIQQEIPYEEVKGELLTGSQMNKVFIEGINDLSFTLPGVDGVMSGKDLRARKERIRTELVGDQLSEYLDKVGAVRVGDTIKIEDKTKLLAILEDEAIMRKYPPNDVLMLKRRVEDIRADGSKAIELAIPLFFNASANKFESMLMSLIRQVGQIYVPGKSYIQASSAGFRFKGSKTFEELGDKARNGIVWVEGYDGSELKTMQKTTTVNEKGKAVETTQPAQVLLPFNFMVNTPTGSKPADINRYITKDAKGKKMIDLNKIPKELLDIIGFRIPTQKQNSMLPMQVVGFIPASMGDTIIVPAALTLQMGSDFDVDKLYVYRRPYKASNDGFRGVENGQDEKKDVLISDYFDIMWAVLNHPEMYDKVLEPLDKDDLKLEAKRAAKNENKAPHYYSPLTQLAGFQAQKDASAMIGVVSQFVTGSVWIENMDLFVGNVTEEDSYIVDYDEDGQPEAQNPRQMERSGLKFIPENGHTIREAYWLSHRAESAYLNEETKEFEYRTKVEDIVTLQNELLDYAKNRTIDNLNINLITIYAALAGVTLSDEEGSKASWKHIVLMLRQPVIRDVVNTLARSQDSLTETYDPAAMQTALIKAALHMRRDVEEFTPKELKAEAVLDLDRLKDGVEKFSNTPAERLYQIQLLNTFERLDKIGKEMAKFQRTFNQDPKGPGKNMITALSRIQDEHDVRYSAVIHGGAALFNTEQGYIHNVELKTARDLYRDILPYETLNDLVTELLSHTGREQFTTTHLTDLTEEFKSYVFSNPSLGLTEQINRDRFRLLYGAQGEKALATRVWEAQNSWGANNYFLRRLSPQQAEKANDPNYIFYQKAQTSSLDDQENSAAFLQLLTSDNEVHRRLGEDLVRYAYVTGGISGSFSFIRYIPTDYLVSLPFASELRQTVKDLSNSDAYSNFDDFVEQWLRHNPQMIRKVSPFMLRGKSDTIGEKFQLQKNTKGSAVANIMVVTPGGPVYPKYLSYYDKEANQWRVYKQSKTMSSEYKRIDSLGNSYVYEYSHQAGYQPSIFIDNQALIDPKENGPAVTQSVRERNIVKELTAQHFSALGITGNLVGADVTKMLSEFSKNKAVEEPIRTLAEQLAPIINRLQRIKPLNLQVKVQQEGDPTGLYSSDSGTITLYQSEGETADTASRTIMHEITHAITSIATMRAASELDAFPEVKEALDKVKEINIEAREAVLAEMKKEGVTEEQVRAVIDGGGSVPDNALNRLSIVYYATSSADEFMSSIFESETFQKFLNSRTSKYSNKSILGRIAEFITKFIHALAKNLGVQVKPQSMLQVGLERSFDVITAIHDNGEQMKAPVSVQKAIADTYFQGKMTPNWKWNIPSEEQAEQIATEIKTDFPWIKTVVTKDVKTGNIEIQLDPKLYKMKLEPDEYRTSTNPIDNLYGKVQEQIQTIKASIAKNKKSPDVLRQNQLIIELKVLAADLKATQDLDKAKDLANYQLDWAQNVKNKYDAGKPVSINQIMTAYRLIDLWSDILNLVYNSDSTQSEIEYDPEFVAIQGDAQKLRTAFLSNIMKQTLNEISQDGLQESDYQNIKDMPVIEGKFLDVARAESRVTQEVGLIIQDTHRAYLEKGQRLLKELEEFENKAKSLAKSRGMKTQDFYNLFMQEGDNWGLVTRFTSNFYRWKSRQRNKLNEKLDKIEASISDKSQKTEAIRSAWSAYWRTIDKNAGFIDVKVLFDQENGNHKETPAAAKYKQEMIEEYGPEIAEELLREAKEKHDSFLQEREDVFNTFDTLVEEDQMTEQEAQEAKSAWVLQYDPADKITSRTVPGKNYSSMSERYLVLVPHNDSLDLNSKSFFEDKYARIQGDEELKAFYEKIQELMERFTSNLPYYLDSKLGPNFLPAIQKELLGSIMDVPSYLAKAPEHIMNMLTASSYEEFMEARSRKDIPILHLDNPFDSLQKPGVDATPEVWAEYNKKKKEKLESYTRNLPRILELFGLMSTHYQTFSEARDAIDLGHEVLRKVDQDLQKGSKQIERDGKIITVKSSLANTLGALEYTRDVLMYRRTRNLEGKITDIARLKNKKDTVEKLRDLKAKEVVLEERFKNNEIGIEEFTKEQEAIELEKSKYQIRKLYASKVGDTLIHWTQLKSLSYNPLSAINNVAFGLISATIFANQNQEYGQKEFWKALSLMMNATGRSLGLARISGNQSAMNRVASKVLSIMDRMNIMGELTETAYAKSNLPESKSGIKTLKAPYQMLRTGDYFVKGINTVATLLKAKVTIDGKEVSVWESIDDNGNWKHKDMPEWQSEDPTEQKEWNKIRNKIIGVNKIVMGNQDKSSPIWAKKNILFRLVGQFRLSWLAEGVASRFESSRDDIQLGREKKGRYRTYADLGFKGSLQVLGRQLLSSLPGSGTDPYKDRRLKNGKVMSDTDKANMRANLTELAWFLLLFGTAKVIGALAAGDDDDKTKKTLWLMANLATRTYQDIGLYSQPTIFDSILGTPAPALGTIRDVSRFVGSSLKYATNDDYEFQQWLLAFTRMGAPIPQSTLINRFNTMMSKDISTIQR